MCQATENDYVRVLLKVMAYTSAIFLVGSFIPGLG